MKKKEEARCLFFLSVLLTEIQQGLALRTGSGELIGLAEAGKEAVALEEAGETDEEEARAEEHQEGSRDPALVGEGVDDTPGVIDTNGGLDPGLPVEAEAVFDVMIRLLGLDDPVFGGAHEASLVASQGLDHSAGVVDAQPNTQRHHDGQIEEALPEAVVARFFLGEQVEGGHREGGGGEHRQVNQDALIPAAVDAEHRRDGHQEAQADHEDIGDIVGQVHEGFKLDLEGQVAFEQGRQDLAGDLNGAFGPTVLLALEGAHLDRDFGGGDRVVDVDELPALDLGAIGEVEVFGEGVVLPPASIFDGAGAPDPGGPVEVEEAP